MVLVADDYSIVRAKMVDGEWMVMTMIKMMMLMIVMVLIMLAIDDDGDDRWLQ